MFRKFTIIVLILLFLCGCSKEAKFGVEQFVSRINKQYEATYKTTDFMLGNSQNDEKFLFCDSVQGLITLSLDNNNDIIGVSLLINESMDINDGINTFCKICSVFTGSDENIQRSTLTNCQITSDTIKYADSNKVITVGKYKYTVVCNEYSITLFCDRV